MSALAGTVSGLLAYLAFPPADLGWIAFVALVPLVINFRMANGAGVALGSAAFSFAFFGLLIRWISENTFAGYIGAVLLITLSVMAALQLGYFVLRAASPKVRTLVFPLAFLAGEFFRGRYPLGGFSWGILGYSQHDNLTALRLAAFTGVWGLSLLILLANALAGEAAIGVLRGRRKTVMRPAVAAAVVALFPAIIPQAPGPSGDTARIAMVQGNVPEGTYDPHVDDALVLRNHIRLSRPLASEPVSLVVWAEGAMDRDPFKDPEMGDALGQAIRQTKKTFLLGTMLSPSDGRGGHRVLNTSLLVNPEAKILRIYAKQRLVPFGEWVPFRRVLEPYFRDIRRVPVDISPGKTPTVFSLPEGKFAAAICYESTYPDLVRSFVKGGARFLVVSSNNSSFGRTANSAQHVAFAQVRAAEHRIWVAQTAISGISAVVAPDGRVTERSGLFEQKVLLPQIRFAERMTLYARFGDWLPSAAIVALAAAGLAGMEPKVLGGKGQKKARSPKG